MPQTYYASNTVSDLTGGGNFDFEFLPNPSTANTANVWSVAKQTTEAFDIFTEAGNPSDSGDATGSWSLELNVIVGSADILANVYIYRVNSGGTIQTGPIESSDTSGNVYPFTAGVLPFAWTNPALGTFQAGDRVRVRVSGTVPGHQGVDLTLGWNTVDSEFIAPYTLAGPQPYAFAVWV